MSALDKMLYMAGNEIGKCALFEVHWEEKLEENAILGRMWSQFTDHLRDQGAEDWWMKEEGNHDV